MKAATRGLMLRDDRRRLAEMPNYLLAEIGVFRGDIGSATDFGTIRRLGSSYRI
jgi:uncharacterized protein YjiS (DUF1127 family)